MGCPQLGCLSSQHHSSQPMSAQQKNMSYMINIPLFFSIKPINWFPQMIKHCEIFA